MNYSTLELPDSCYADIAHLNYKGAKIFSEKLNRDLKSYKQKITQCAE
jgi:hypothetical protein